MRSLSEARSLASAQHGAVSTAQLRQLGMTWNEIDRLRHDGWRAITDRVLLIEGGPATRGRRLVSATLDAGPPAVISHVTAAAWWGLPGFALTPISVTTVRHGTLRTAVWFDRGMELSVRTGTGSLTLTCRHATPVLVNRI